jgi:hypothetical protein
MDRSPQWAKNAANAAKRRAMKRAELLGSMSGVFDIRNNGRVTNYTQRNREGREYKIFHGRNWARNPEQISGPQMPSAYLPKSGYGASPRPYYTMEPLEKEFGEYNAATGETAYGGRRRKTRRKSRSRKTRRNNRR